MWLFPSSYSSYSRSSHSREDTFGREFVQTSTFLPFHQSVCIFSVSKFLECALAAFQLTICPSHYFGFQGTGGKSNSTEHKKNKIPVFLSFAQSRHVGRRRETLRVADWRYLDVTLGAQVVDLRGLHLVDDLHQTRAVCQIAVVQLHVLTERRTNRFFHRFLTNGDVLVTVNQQGTYCLQCVSEGSGRDAQCDPCWRSLNGAKHRGPIQPNRQRKVSNMSMSPHDQRGEERKRREKNITGRRFLIYVFILSVQLKFCE